MVRKLPIGQGKYVTTAGRVTLIKSVTTCQAIYSLTALVPPKDIMKAILKLERHPTRWDLVCWPKNMGDLGVLAGPREVRESFEALMTLV
jgi:hypothetical protein